MTYSQRFKEFSDHVYSLVLLKRDLQYYLAMPLEYRTRLISKTPGLLRMLNLITRNLVIGVYICFKESEHYSFKKVGKSILKSAEIDERGRMMIQQALEQAAEFSGDSLFKDHISGFRNEHFAHLDINRHQHRYNLLYEEIIGTVTLIQDLHKKIHEALTPGQLSYLQLENSTQQHIFKALEAYHRVWDLVEERQQTLQDGIPFWDVFSALTQDNSQSL